jgi:hypothetical protein
MMSVEQLVERLAGEAEVLREMPQRIFQMTRPDLRGGNPTTNRRSYGTADALFSELQLRSF